VQLAFRIMGIAARLLLALGAVCLLLGAYLATQTMNFTNGAQATTGTVVRYYENQEGGRTSYRPVFRFTTASGDIITTTEALPSSSKRFEVGAQVPVQYPFEQPTKARIATFAGQLSSGSKRFETGTQVPVVYPFGTPQQARISTFTDNWLGATIAGVIGVLALVAGVFIRRAASREAARGGA